VVGELPAETITTEVVEAEAEAAVETKTEPEAIRIKAPAVVMVLTTSRRKVSKLPRFACINKKVKNQSNKKNESNNFSSFGARERKIGRIASIIPSSRSLCMDGLSSS